MNPPKRNYDNLTAICKGLGFVQFVNRLGEVEEGIYTLNGFDAPIDLSSCAEGEMAVLKEAVRQLSECVDDSHQAGIERDLNE